MVKMAGLLDGAPSWAQRSFEHPAVGFPHEMANRGCIPSAHTLRPDRSRTEAGSARAPRERTQRTSACLPADKGRRFRGDRWLRPEFGGW